MLDRVVLLPSQCSLCSPAVMLYLVAWVCRQCVSCDPVTLHNTVWSPRQCMVRATGDILSRGVPPGIVSLCMDISRVYASRFVTVYSITYTTWYGPLANVCFAKPVTLHLIADLAEGKVLFS
jgi:hypothetical protein